MVNLLKRFVLITKLTSPQSAESKKMSLRYELTSITPCISNLLQDILPDMNLTDGEIGEWIREDYTDEPEAIDLSDEEIAENVQIEKTQKVKLDDAIKALDICMEWATENDIPYEKLIALQEIKEAAISQKVKTYKI